MGTKIDNAAIAVNDNAVIVSWEPKYSVGIKLINDQHMELIKLTNALYKACLSRDKSVAVVFKESMSHMVEYVRYHFNAEVSLLERVGYPNHYEHKKQHEALIREILIAVKNYEEGNKLAPNVFVRTLKEWVFGHIAICDQAYAAYIHENLKKGLITEDQLK